MKYKDMRAGDTFPLASEPWCGRVTVKSIKRVRKLWSMEIEYSDGKIGIFTGLKPDDGVAGVERKFK